MVTWEDQRHQIHDKSEHIFEQYCTASAEQRIPETDSNPLEHNKYRPKYNMQ